MMENVPTLNPLVVNTVKDSSTLFVVSMESLTIISVTYNAPKLTYSAEVLAHQSEPIVNVIKDMFLFVVLITKLTETIV